MNPFNALSVIKETNKHFICRCPFCGDSNNRTHAHLYISKKYPVFKCFRCNMQGHISLLEKQLHEECKYEYTNTIQYNLPTLDVSIVLEEVNDMLEAYAPYISNEEIEYFKSRTHLKNFTIDTVKKFGLFPDYSARSYLYNLDKKKFSVLLNEPKRVWTLRGFGSALSGRSIDKNISIRYVVGELILPWTQFVHSDTFFVRSKVVQEYNPTRVPPNLVCAEGVYDCINLYLNRSRFRFDDSSTLFVAVQCSDYRRAIKLFQMMYDTYPKNIEVFADIDRTPDMMRKMFENDINKSNITIHWPKVKDWDPIGPIKCSINLGGGYHYSHIQSLRE